MLTSDQEAVAPEGAGDPEAAGTGDPDEPGDVDGPGDAGTPDAAADGALDSMLDAAGRAAGEAGANVQPDDAEPHAATSVAIERTTAGTVRRERLAADTGSG